ncbi:MAG: CFI-box-CTERM domain-containing protein [Anaerolineae bacterium]
MKEQITGNDWRGRRAGRLVGALGLLLALVLLVGVLPAYANDLEPPPQLPHYFAGTVSTSTGSVPEGTVVEALLDGVKKAETTVNNQSGYVLLVPGEVGDEGKIVSFKVAGVQASQTAAWVSGEFNYNFNLTITALPGGSWFPFDCFIATAVYGTDTAEEINILRQFRDVVLLASHLGAEFVSLYYEVSPPIAKVISQHDSLRTAVRLGFIGPVVAILNWSHALWSERD